MRLWRIVRHRFTALFARARVERDLHDELEFHVAMEARKLAAAGLSPESARARATARFGSTTAAVEGCRDVRGMAFVESCVRDVAYALRSFRRAPTVALTVVGTVALGLGLVAAVFTVFSHFVFRTAAVHDPSSLFAVEGAALVGSERIRFTRPQYESLRRETDVFSDTFATAGGITSRIDGRRMEGNLVTGNYFDVLGARVSHGRPLTPDDDGPGGEAVMVLSHSGWSRLFASAPDVVGRTVPVNGLPYTVVGVAPEGFLGLGPFAPDYWAPLARLGQFRPSFAGREDALPLDIVGRLKAGIAPGAAQAALNVWASGGVSVPADRRTAGVRLESRRTAIQLSPLIVLAFSPLYIAFGLVLLIGCANVANLLLARAVLRQREIAVRLSIGASRRRIVRQLLTESLLLGLAAAAAALVVSRGVLHVMIAGLLGTMPPELAEYAGALNVSTVAADWRVVVFLVAAAIVSTAFFGLAPALHATRLNLVRAVRGEVIGAIGPGRARNLLVVVQVTASVILLICAAVFLRGTVRASAADPGLRTDDTIVVAIANEPLRTPFVAALTADSTVAAVAATWRDPMGRPRAAFASPMSAETTRDATRPASGSPENYRFVSPTYFDVLDIPVLRGRTFTDAEASSMSAVVVVSEAAASRLWPNEDAIGHAVRLEPDPDTRAAGEPALPAQVLTVVGVVADVAGFGVGGFGVAGQLETGFYVPATPATAATSLVLRVHGDPERARQALVDRLVAIDPNMGDIMTMRTIARLETYPLQLGFWLTTVLGALALALTVSGIFGVLSYLVGQRTKEIGVRIALGATAGSIVRLVLSQSLRVVAVGLVAGTGLAWLLATLLLTTPATESIGGIVDVRDPLAYVGSVVCIVIACVLAASVPAQRAARVDPIMALRHD